MTWAPWRALSEVAKIEFGERVTRRLHGGTKFPVFGGGGETFRIDRWNRENCMIVSRFGMSATCVRRVTGRFFLNDSGLSVHVRPETGLLQPFLDQYLVSMQPEIFAMGTGAAQKNLDSRQFQEMLVPVPSLAEQQRIVAKLDEVDADVRTLSDRLDAELLRSAQVRLSVMNEVFLRGPGRETQEGSLITRGWPPVRLASVVSLDALTATPNDLSDDDLYIGLENIGPNGELIGLGDVRATSLRSTKNRFTSNDVLFGKLRPYLTKVARPTGAGVCSTDILVLRPSDALDRDYLYWWLRSPTVIEDATARSTGATLPRISPSTLGEFEIPVPPLAGQQRIVAKLDEVQSACAEVSANIERRKAKAGELRQSVLAGAFRGEL